MMSLDHGLDIALERRSFRRERLGIMGDLKLVGVRC